MRTFIVDAFTDAPFGGNPAGVCLVEAPLGEVTMLRIAQELNLSETAFVAPSEPGARGGAENRFSIRYFSPKMEIPLCGHATLGSARVLFSSLPIEEVCFRTFQGLDLSARRAGPQIALELPAYSTRPAEAPPALLAALGLASVVNATYNPELGILLLEIDDCGRLRELRPDFAALLRSHASINGVAVTAPSSGDGFDFHSRYFWPWSGSDEDPVTGGTHTFLTPYWAERLGKTRMRAFQSSARTGFMELELRGDTVVVLASAVIVFDGRLVAPEGATERPPGARQRP